MGSSVADLVLLPTYSQLPFVLAFAFAHTYQHRLFVALALALMARGVEGVMVATVISACLYFNSS
jgi:hypothetical protein